MQEAWACKTHHKRAHFLCADAILDSAWYVATTAIMNDRYNEQFFMDPGMFVIAMFPSKLTQPSFHKINFVIMKKERKNNCTGSPNHFNEMQV